MIRAVGAFSVRFCPFRPKLNVHVALCRCNLRFCSSVPTDPHRKPQHRTLAKGAAVRTLDLKEPGNDVRSFTFTPPQQPDHPKYLTACLAGYPNVGKSTLLNTLLDNKVSIVSPKAQTTRERVRGVWTDVPSSTQIVFHDTPGVLPAEERSQFGIHSLADVTYGALETTDVGIVVLDAAFMVRAIASNGGELPVSVVQQIEDLTVKAERRIAVLNKTDLVSDKSSLLPTVKALQTAFPQTFSDVFLVSAIKGSGLQELRKYLLGVAPSGMWLYPPDLSTDQSQLKRATECIREAIFLRLNAELPYTLKIDIPSWTPFKNGDVRIDAEVIVQSRSQLRILIGENGQAIKWIREHAQEGIQQFLNRTVHLFVRGVMK